MQKTSILKQAAPRGKWRRALRAALLAIALLVLAAVAYYLLHYHFYDRYRDFLKDDYKIEDATAFAPLRDAEARVPGMALAAENDALMLYIDESTAEVAVYDKRNGVTVYSTPKDAENDPVANKTNKNYLRSQFVLDYYNAARTAGTYDSYSMSVARGQFALERLENGVRVTYEVGEKPVIDYYVPIYLSGEMYDSLVSGMDDSGQTTMSGAYKQSADGLYTMIENIRANARRQRALDKLLKARGFTEEDYFAQNALGGAVAQETMLFTLALEYRLDGDALEVKMPVRLMKETGGGSIYRVQLLRALGAAGTDETGYMVMPNGSGCLIRFNNGKTNAAAYTQYVYDIDDIDANYTKTENAQTARLPLYGICREQSALLVTVERGASLCYLTADISGKLNSYNAAYPTFVLRGYDKLSMFGVSGAEADMPILEKNLYDEDVTVRYTLLTDEYVGYSGLANYYRERLIKEGALSPLENASSDLPFYYDVIGGVKETSHFLGVSYLRVHAMTTFSEAAEMARELSDLGIQHQVVNLSGWFNGGYYHDVADRVDVLQNLGGRAGLEQLNESVRALGGTLYAETAFQHVTQISKRYISSLENARYYGAGYSAMLGQVNPGTLRRVSTLGYDETVYSLLSPKFLPRYVEAFAGAIRGINVDGISLRDLGSALHADKRRTNVISREQALDVVTAQFETLFGTGRALMISGGNLYALRHAQNVIGAPITASGYFITDEEIPLYEMIVHGCLNYAGEPMNVTDTADSRAQLLHLIEYGASCRYVFTARDAVEMKYSGLNRYYATSFQTWKDAAKETYAYLNGALKYVGGAKMIGHDVLENGVKRVTYDNGVMIYINFADDAAIADGIVVPANDYLVKEGAKP